MSDGYVYDSSFPRKPHHRSVHAGRQMPGSAMPASTTAGAMHYEKDKYETERKQRVIAANGEYKEKERHQHKEVDSTAVVFVDNTRQPMMQSTTGDDCAMVRKDCGDSWGCMWIVWIVLIFIIILIIVLGALWFIKPDCVTRDCDTDDSGCEVDLCRAALFAFVITFFIVLIGCCIWWCCRRY